ncbi:hypothetical protein C8R43DRAFT_1016998 [Mycena crocata]|nr:hypothetical protein C8R43DRAFT_1016998 [Mycena crocata]
MTNPQQPPSPRRTFSDRMSAVGARINRALTSEGQLRPNQNGYDPETESITSTIVEPEDHSGYYSGRGGAGNFHPNPAHPKFKDFNNDGDNSSYTKSASLEEEDAQEFPWPRGRDRAPAVRGTPRYTGRGGFGNFNRRPVAPIDPAAAIREQEILRAHAEREAERAPFRVRSSGRGGFGNMVSPAPVRVPIPILPTSADGGSPTMPRARSRSVDPVSAPTALPSAVHRGMPKAKVYRASGMPQPRGGSVGVNGSAASRVNGTMAVNIPTNPNTHPHVGGSTNTNGNGSARGT